MNAQSGFHRTAEALDLGCFYMHMVSFGAGKAVIFESLISYQEWATASQIKMGRPKLVSAWDSSWPQVCSAMPVAKPCSVTKHVVHFGRL